MEPIPYGTHSLSQNNKTPTNPISDHTEKKERILNYKYATKHAHKGKVLYTHTTHSHEKQNEKKGGRKA
jgi:hypothetical protein